MRAFSLTPEYEPQRFPAGYGQTPRKFLLEMDEYEVANLQRLLLAVGGHTGESERFIREFNTGDWVGQIGFYLPAVEHRPNAPYPNDSILSEFARKLLARPIPSSTSSGKRSDR